MTAQFSVSPTEFNAALDLVVSRSEGALVVNALEQPGILGKDGNDDGPGIAAVVAEMNAQLTDDQRGVLYLPRPDEFYLINSIINAANEEPAHPGGANCGPLMGRVSIQGADRNLVQIRVGAGVNTNALMWQGSLLGSVATITADVQVGQNVYTVDAIPSGLVVGDEVWVRVGVSTYDSAECRWWDIGTVMDITGLEITLDVPSPHPMVVGSTAAIHRSIQKVSVLDNLSCMGVSGGFLGAASDNWRHVFGLYLTRNFKSDAWGDNVGSGLFQGSYNKDPLFHGPYIKRSDAVMPAAGITGFQPRGRSGINLYSSKNVLIDGLGADDVANTIAYSEASNRGYALRNVRARVNNREQVSTLAANASIGATSITLGTTLTSNVLAGATSLPVASTFGWRRGRRVRIGSETVTVTGISGNTATITPPLVSGYSSGDPVRPAKLLLDGYRVQIAGTIDVRTATAYDPSTGVLTLGPRIPGETTGLTNAHTAGQTVTITKRVSSYLMFCGGDSDLTVDGLVLEGDPSASVLSLTGQDGQATIRNLTDMTHIDERRSHHPGRYSGLFRTLDKNSVLRTWDMDNPREHTSTVILVDAQTTTWWHPNGLLKEVAVELAPGVGASTLTTLSRGREFISSSAQSKTSGSIFRERPQAGSVFPTDAAWEYAIKFQAVCASGTAVSTTLTEAASSGQKNIYVTSVANITPGTGLRIGASANTGVVDTVASSPDAGHGNGYLVTLRHNLVIAPGSGETVYISLQTAQVSGSTAVAVGDRTLTTRAIHDLAVGMKIVVGTGATRELRTIQRVNGNVITVDSPFNEVHAVLDPIFTKQLRIKTRTCWPIDGISEPTTKLTADAGASYVEYPQRFQPEAVYY